MLVAPPGLSDLEKKNLVKREMHTCLTPCSYLVNRKRGTGSSQFKKNLRIIIIANLSSGHFVRGTRVNKKIV